MTEHVFEVAADVGSVAITSSGVRFFFANGYGDGTHKCIVCDADENFDGGLDTREDSPERHWNFEGSFEVSKDIPYSFASLMNYDCGGEIVYTFSPGQWFAYSNEGTVIIRYVDDYISGAMEVNER
jgi:hypothetical protein